MALRSVPEHPKFARLKHLLKAPKYGVLGLLEGVWHFCGRFTPQGNIGRYSDAEIESWVEWSGTSGGLISALRESGWLDEHSEHRLVVHDWHEHADATTRRNLGRKKLPFVTDMSMTCHGRAAPEPAPEPVPEPVPEPGAATAAWPKTADRIYSTFPAADDEILKRIVKTAQEAMPDITDRELFDSLGETFIKTQTSPGLWLKTLPTFISRNAARFRSRRPSPNQETRGSPNGPQRMGPSSAELKGDVYVQSG